MWNTPSIPSISEASCPLAADGRHTADLTCPFTLSGNLTKKDEPHDENDQGHIASPFATLDFSHKSGGADLFAGGRILGNCAYGGRAQRHCAGQPTTQQPSSQ